jgi:hypothetical protein
MFTDGFNGRLRLAMNTKKTQCFAFDLEFLSHKNPNIIFVSSAKPETALQEVA